MSNLKTRLYYNKEIKPVPCDMNSRVFDIAYKRLFVIYFQP